MHIEQQGDNYDPKARDDYEDDEDLDLDEDDLDDDEDDEAPEVETLWGIPKKFVLLGAVGILVVIIAIVVFSMAGHSSSAEAPEEETEETSEEEIDMAALMGETQPVEAPVEEPVEDDFTVQDLIDDESDEALLQLYGFTAEQIAIAKEHNLSVSAMVEYVEEKQAKHAKEELAKYADTAGEAYQELLNLTYLGQDDNYIPVDQNTVETPRVITNSFVVNADYVKCPVKGYQLFLKCKIGENNYAFLTVEPARWIKLPDRGNIILKVDAIGFGKGDYITHIEETDSTMTSVSADATLEPLEHSTQFANNLGTGEERVEIEMENGEQTTEDGEEVEEGGEGEEDGEDEEGEAEGGEGGEVDGEAEAN